MGTKALENLLQSQTGLLYHQAQAALAQNDTLVFTGSVACANNAVFDLASVSKLLTGTMALALAGQGKLPLDEPVLQYFESQPIEAQTSKCMQAITPAQLLAHSSGLPAWYPFYTGKGSFWQILEHVLQSGPLANQTVYSDIGFMLLGLLIQQVTGQTMQENLAALNRALGAGFCYNPTNTQNCVATEYGNQVEMGMCKERGLAFAGWRGTKHQIQGSVNDGNAFYFWHGAAGHAGVFGTVQDLLLLAGLYINGGAVGGVQLIPEWLVGQSLQNAGGNRGLVWDLSDTFPNGAGHTGFTGTALWICPEKKAAMALLTSRLPLPGPPNLNPWRRQCFQAAYNALQ